MYMGGTVTRVGSIILVRLNSIIFAYVLKLLEFGDLYVVRPCGNLWFSKLDTSSMQNCNFGQSPMGN